MLRFLSVLSILCLLAFASIAWLKNTSSGIQTSLNSGEDKSAKKAKKKIVFIAGKCSHGALQHEHKAGCMLLADALNKSMPNTFETSVYYQGWPDAKAFENVSAVVMYMDGGGGHPALQHLPELDALTKKGVGIANLHYAVEVTKDPGGAYFLNWVGGYFEVDWSVNPTWEAQFTSLPKHPVANGVKPFTIKDEWYYHMRFRDNMKGVTPILTAIPPASTLSRADGPHSNNQYVRAEAGKAQHMSWVAERADGGRGFGFTGGHFHNNWGDENFRKVVLNGIAWIAKVKIPKKGLESPALSAEDLKKNLDIKPCPK